MTAHQAVNWFNRGWEIQKEIDQLELAKKRAKQSAFDCLTTCTAQTDKTPVQGGLLNGVENRLADYIDGPTKFEQRIKNQLVLLYEIQAEIIQGINQIDNSTLRAILLARYVNYMKWEDIAKEMQYSYRWTVQLHNKAINTALKSIETVCENII